MFNIPLDTIKQRLSANSYDTPEDTPRFIGDRIFLSSRWWFFILYSGTVVKSMFLAKRNRYDSEKWIQSSIEVMDFLEGCGARFHIEGLDNIRKIEEPVVIVSNHMSTLETMIFPGLIRPFRPITFVVKDSLVKGPIFGPIMRSSNPIVVGRTNAMEDFRIVMSQGEEMINKGFSPIIFPQSTRTHEFIPEKFNTLGVKLAKKMGVKLLPTAIKTDFWGDSKILKGFGALDRKKPVHMTFGEPIPVVGNGKEEHQMCIDFIVTHLKQWGHPLSMIKEKN